MCLQAVLGKSNDGKQGTEGTTKTANMDVVQLHS